MDKEIGTCPICGIRNELKDDFVVCPEGHYKISWNKWDEIWINFDYGSFDVDTLLGTLRKENLIHSDEILPH